MRLVPLAGLAIWLAWAAPAAAVDRYAPMRVPDAPGLVKYNRVWVQQLGPERATQVVVLVPGTQGGAGGITPIAHDILLARRLWRRGFDFGG